VKTLTIAECDSEVRRLWNLTKRYPEGQSNKARLARIDDFLELRLNLQRAQEVEMELVGSSQRV